MAKIQKLAYVPKVDTRGLPFGLDPRKFYEYSSQKRRKYATGIEGYLYNLMPYNLIKSLAFAIDPLSQFKVSATRISPANRTRRRFVSSVLDKRGYVYRKISQTDPYKYDLDGSYDLQTSTSSLTPQPALLEESIDIVKRDRPVGSDMGEFTKWQVRPSSPGRTARDFYEVLEWYNGSPGYYYHNYQTTTYTSQGPAAYITQSKVDELRAKVANSAIAAMQSKALVLYRGCSSQRRATTLTRNLIELRDMPRAVLQLQESLKRLRALSDALKIPKNVLARIHAFKTTGFQIPKEYLSYQFGWRQTYSDIRDLLLAPERISKRVNFLIRRNGKATTYRSQAEVPDSYATSSGFAYNVFTNENVKSTNTQVSMNHILKMVINATFEFPDVDTPLFREKEYSRQLGVVPTPMDLYNLVPWTWLFDWFSGFGNYLNIIEVINDDTELINWGLLTAKTQGVLKTTFDSETRDRHYLFNQPVRYRYNRSSHISRLDFDSQLRIDVATVLNVRSTGDPNSLSSFQLSILGSILAGKLKF